MKKQDFKAVVSIKNSPKEAFERIAQVGDWWAKDFTGRAVKQGDRFTIRFGDTFVDFKITETIPDTKIVWYVTDSYLSFQRDKTEWNNTEVVFEISSTNNQTQIDFTHVGLVPGIECYEQCKKGWTRFVTISLPKFIHEGKGLPE